MNTESKMSAQMVSALWSADPKDYVDIWAREKNYIYKKSGVWSNGRDELRTDQIKTQIFVDYHVHHAKLAREIAKKNKEVSASNKVSLPYKKKDLLHAAVDMKIIEEVKRRLNEIRLKLMFDPKADPAYIEAWKFVGNITTVDVELGTHVLLHFIWQVKRKLFGLPVEYHLVPVLTGAGGLGKSQNLKRLLGPIADYTFELASAAQLTDVNSFQAFGENFVATLDEFAKMDKQDFNVVKNFITAEYLTSRTLYTNSLSSNKQNVTIIATSNFSINEQIFESAGMRRFYEYKIDKSINMEVSLSIGYLSLWKCVDENGPAPILPYLEQLARHQEAIRTPEPMELFFEEFNIDPKKPLTFRVDSREGIYKTFIEWSQKVGFDAPWMKREQHIRTKLLNRGLKQVTINGKKVWYVNEDCKLNPLFEHVVIPRLESEQDLLEIKSIPELEKMLNQAVKNTDYVLAAGIKRRIEELKNKHGGINGFLLDL